MARAVEMVGGGILGFIAGSLLCAPLIAHVFGPTTVTWDASGCPPGIYTITSTATSLTDSRSFTAVTQHIRLPKASIVQEFGDLPLGQYQVTAIARDARGRTFPSDTQTVFGQGPSRGRQSARTTSIPQPYRPPDLTRPASASVTPPPISSTNEAPNRTETVSPTFVRMSEALIDRLLAENGAQDALESFAWWKSVTFIDEGDDGVIDLIRIEWITGRIWFASIERK